MCPSFVPETFAIETNVEMEVFLLLEKNDDDGCMLCVRASSSQVEMIKTKNKT